MYGSLFCLEAWPKTLFKVLIKCIHNKLMHPLVFIGSTSIVCLTLKRT